MRCRFCAYTSVHQGAGARFVRHIIGEDLVATGILQGWREGGREGGGEDPHGAAGQAWEGAMPCCRHTFVESLISISGRGIMIRFLFRLIFYFSTSVNGG